MGSKELSVKKGNEPRVEKRVGTRLTPAVDILETEEGLTLVADLPGVGREDLQLGIDRDILTIEGKAAAASGYYRRFQLPDNLDLERVAAELRDGVLTLTMPRAAAARPRRIEVAVH